MATVRVAILERFMRRSQRRRPPQGLTNYQCTTIFKPVQGLLLETTPTIFTPEEARPSSLIHTGAHWANHRQRPDSTSSVTSPARSASPLSAQSPSPMYRREISSGSLW
ncbi:MAG: hypothetical protein RQM92_06020 [Candidatus Syntrophopropionicum ammoniitolerans]